MNFRPIAIILQSCSEGANAEGLKIDTSHKTKANYI